MTVDRAKAIMRRTPQGTVYLCSEHCAHQFDVARAAPGTPAHAPT